MVAVLVVLVVVVPRVFDYLRIHAVLWLCGPFLLLVVLPVVVAVDFFVLFEAVWNIASFILVSIRLTVC